LIATLDADPEVKEAWAAEVERRQSEIENGTVSLLLGPETLVKLKAEFECTPCTRRLREASGRCLWSDWSPALHQALR